MTSQWGLPQREMYLGDRPALVADVPWIGLNFVALVASVLVLSLATGIVGARLRAGSRSIRDLVRWPGTPTGILATFIGATAAGLFAYGLGNPVFDRYLWPVVPPLAILLMYVPHSVGVDRDGVRPAARTGAVGVAMAGVIVAGLGTLALAYAANANAFDAALWRAGEALVAAGVPRDEVDAGYAWVGEHATTPLTGGGDHPFRYRQLWPDFRQCGSVTSDPTPEAGTIPAGTESYLRFLITGPAETLYLFRGAEPGCMPR
jgi:hypothetical protein